MSTARAPWHRLAGPSDAPETPCYCGAGPLSACPGDWDERCGSNIRAKLAPARELPVEIPPRLYLAAALEPIELPPRLTRHDSAEVAAAALAEYRAQSDAEAIKLEESTTHPADKLLAALAVALLTGMAIGAAMPWLAPAMLSWLGVV